MNETVAEIVDSAPIRARRLNRELLSKIARTVIGSLAIILLWQLLSSYVIDPFLLPPPMKVAETLWSMMQSGVLLTDVLASGRRILVGYVLGCAVGIVWGLLIGRIAWVSDLSTPFLEFIRPLSPIAILPLVLVWFGIGEASKYFLVGYIATIVVLINTVAGVTSVPKLRLRAAACLGASERQIFLYVILPSSIPYIVTGMRVGLGLSFMAIVAAEMIAADSGIGYSIMQARNVVQVNQIFAGLVTLSVLGILCDLAFRVTLSRIAKEYQQEIHNA